MRAGRALTIVVVELIPEALSDPAIIEKFVGKPNPTTTKTSGEPP